MPPKPIVPHPGPTLSTSASVATDQLTMLPSHTSYRDSSSPVHSQSSSSHLAPAPSSTAAILPSSSSNLAIPPQIRTSDGTVIASKILNARAHGTVADAVAASLGSKRERKRKRVHYSCAECHRRKHKCDRQTPCQPCIDRGLGDTCRPFEDGDQFGDMRDRVQRLEDIVESLAVAQAELAKELSEANKHGFEYIEMGTTDEEQDLNAAAAAAQNPPRPKRRKRQRVIRPDTLRGMEREELYNSETRAVAAFKGETIDSSTNQRPLSAVRYDEGGNPLEGGLARDGDSWFGALALPSVSRGVIETEIHGERLELGANFPRYPASVKLHRLIHEGGASENILSELMGCLPSKQETDLLLDVYFRDINLTRLPIDEGTFRQSYQELMEFRWGNAKEERGDDGARHVPFLAFLFSVLATAMRSLPESMGSEAYAKKGAMRLYHACRKTINVASTIRVDHIDLVLAHMFASRFLICQRQSAESWSLLGNAIRAAQAIGLHRDGSKLGLDAVTTERRRRLWSLIFYMDKTTSILLGRPQAIQDIHCDTLPPSDVDIDTMPRAARPHVPRTKPRPYTPPGVYLFVAIRHDFARLTGKVVEHFQNLANPRRYTDVVTLDQELEKFRSEIPDFYRMDRSEDGSCVGTDKSFDQACPWLPIHRYLLNIEYHYVRIALHRPYVLRNSEKYAHSRTAAFESARADRMVRQEYRKDVKWEPDCAKRVHMGGLYRLFNSTMMIGIALLLDPTGSEAADCMAFLDEFIEVHRNRAGETDQCSKREVKIIELFRSKARDPTWCAISATGSSKRATTTEAQSPSLQGQPGMVANTKGTNGAATADTQPSHAKVGHTGANPAKVVVAASGGASTSSSAHRHILANGNKPPANDVFNGGAAGGGFNGGQFFAPGASSLSPGGVPSAAAEPGSSHSGEGITPPPYSGLFGNPISVALGSVGLGYGGGVQMAGSASDRSMDLAQSIFDQLGGYEPSFSMLNPNPNDALNFASGNGFGAEATSFDSSNNAFDLSSFWNSPASNHPRSNGDGNGSGQMTIANHPASTTPSVSISPSKPSESITTTLETDSNRSTSFRPTAHPHLRALGAAQAAALAAAAAVSSSAGFKSSSNGSTTTILDTGSSNVNRGTIATPSSAATGTGTAVASGGGDWGLLPWGGLIEAIAQSSHGIELTQQQQQQQSGGQHSKSNTKKETK